MEGEMMDMAADKSSSVGDHVKLRRPERQIPSIIHSTLSSFLVSSSATTIQLPVPRLALRLFLPTNKKRNILSQQVSVPEVIRASEDWLGKKTRESERRRRTRKSKTHQGISCSLLFSVFGSTRESINQNIKERAFTRDDRPLDFPRTWIVMFRNNRIVGGRFESRDQFRDWRLDVDNMSYEELLKLCDRIGYVSTGLKDDEIGRSVAKMKLSNSGELSKYSSSQVDKKCSICQEEYEGEDEVGKLNCGHGYHLMCIKRWLAEKNACPVCKTGVSSRSPP